MKSPQRKKYKRWFILVNNNFWDLINRSKEHGEEQVEWLTNELVKQKTEEIFNFEIEFKNKMDQSYTPSLWWAGAP
jgi:hypothetical protein